MTVRNIFNILAIVDINTLRSNLYISPNNFQLLANFIENILLEKIFWKHLVL